MWARSIIANSKTVQGEIINIVVLGCFNFFMRATFMKQRELQLSVVGKLTGKGGDKGGDAESTENPMDEDGDGEDADAEAGTSDPERNLATDVKSITDMITTQRFQETQSVITECKLFADNWVRARRTTPQPRRAS